jgi:hypothetical protein
VTARLPAVTESVPVPLSVTLLAVCVPADTTGSFVAVPIETVSDEPGTPPPHPVQLVAVAQSVLVVPDHAQLFALALSGTRSIATAAIVAAATTSRRGADVFLDGLSGTSTPLVVGCSGPKRTIPRYGGQCKFVPAYAGLHARIASMISSGASSWM